MKYLISLCKILIGVVMFTIISLCMLILYSDATFKNVFTCGRVSILQTQKSYSNEIVIDTSYLLTNGGVKNLTEKLIAGIASKRPKWRLIILTNKNALHDKFKNLRQEEYVDSKVFYFYWPRRNGATSRRKGPVAPGGGWRRVRLLWHSGLPESRSHLRHKI